MSIHRSLSPKERERKPKSVLKRMERIKILMDKGIFKEGFSSCFGLPKSKILRIKIKKEKTREATPPTSSPEEKSTPSQQKSL